MTSCAPDRLGQGPGSEWLCRAGRGRGRVGGRGQRSGPSEADRSRCLLFLCCPQAKPVLTGDRPGLRVSLLPSPTHCTLRAGGGRPPSYQLRLTVTEPRTNQSSPGRRSSQRPPWSGPGHTSASGTPAVTVTSLDTTGSRGRSRVGKPRPPAASPDPALNHPTVSEQRSIGRSPHPGLSSGAALCQPRPSSLVSQVGKLRHRAATQ